MDLFSLKRLGLCVALGWISGAAIASAPTNADLVCGRVVRESEGSKVPARAVYSPDRLRYVQHALPLLLQGGLVVSDALGDSIVGNTFGPQCGGNPPFIGPTAGTDLIAQYFGTTVRGGAGARGSTGMQFYANPQAYASVEPNWRMYTIPNFVLIFRPDVVFIGGISNQLYPDPIGAMADVVGQIRTGALAQGQPQPPDIVLMTGAVDLVATLGGAPAPPTSTILLDPSGTTYEAQLKALAEQLGAGFIDLRGSYNEFVRESYAENPAANAAFFQTLNGVVDPVHAGPEGINLLHELIAMYFRPAIQCADRAPARVAVPDPPVLTLSDIKGGLGQVASIATADVNGDGHQDLAVFTTTGPGMLFLAPVGSGQGVQLGSVALHNAVFADLDGSGALDLVGIDSTGSVRILFGSRSGGAPYSGASQAITLAGATQATSIAVLDANQDGHNDLLVARNGGATLTLYLNEGGSTPFTAPSMVDLPAPATNVSEATQLLQVADVNHDGHPDIVELRMRTSQTVLSGQFSCGPPAPVTPTFLQSGGYARLTVRLNTGGPAYFASTGTYALPLGSMQPTSMALADLNGDGNVDLVLGTSASDGSPEGSQNDSIYVFPNSGRVGTWFFDPVRLVKSASSSCTGALRIADVDGDGRPDIVTTDGCGNSTGGVDYYKNTGVITDFSLQQPTRFASGLSNVDLALADLHASGAPDVIVAGNDTSGAGAVVQLSSYSAAPPPSSSSGAGSSSGGQGSSSSSGGQGSSSSSGGQGSSGSSGGQGSSGSSGGQGSGSSGGEGSGGSGGGAFGLWELLLTGVGLGLRRVTGRRRGASSLAVPP